VRPPLFCEAHFFINNYIRVFSNRDRSTLQVWPPMTISESEAKQSFFEPDPSVRLHNVLVHEQIKHITTTHLSQMSLKHTQQQQQQQQHPANEQHSKPKSADGNAMYSSKVSPLDIVTTDDSEANLSQSSLHVSNKPRPACILALSSIIMFGLYYL